MKSILTILFTICIADFAFAQTPDKALARVSYNLIHIRDTTQKNFPYTENMLLVIGKNASVFTSYDKINREIEFNNPRRKASTAPFKPVTQSDYYYFVKENKVFTRDKMLTNYLAEEIAPVIKWQITKDTSSFSGIHCLKAITHFKGRNWIAWFAPELPFQSGPWKLNGLPGLIIEAYDDKKEVQFQFAGLENTGKLSEAQKLEQKKYKDNIFFGPEIIFPKDAVKTTKQEFDKLKDAFEKDPKGFISAATGTPVNRIYTGVSMNGEIHKTINNPIELIEKK
ncbi:MAG: GLPGLI family protein [Bacteroidota bacterium]